MDYYTILKSHRAGLVKPREVEDLKLLAPHLVSAYTTSALVNKYRAQAESLGALIANAGFGIVLVTATRRVVYANDMAEAAMRKRCGLCYAHGRVGAVEPQADKKLEALVLGASRPQQNMMQAGSIPLTGEDGSISRVIHVVPLSASSSALLLDQEHPSVGIFVVDLCRETTSDRIKSFAMLYRLPPGESRLMANLISGEGVLEAAERLNITEGTARTHLKHIFAKTDTHRQAELLRLFFEATIPFEAQQASTISCRQYF